MVGIADGDQSADFQLGILVGRGDRIEVAAFAGLVFQAVVGAEQGQGDGGRRRVQLKQEGFELGETGGCEGRGGHGRKA